jgi:hypothetical protein
MTLEPPGIYEFRFADSINWVVRLSNNTNTHSPDVLAWLCTRFGDEDPEYYPKIFRDKNLVPLKIWKKGAICTYVYQEYWFTSYDEAFETWLTFS